MPRRRPVLREPGVVAATAALLLTSACGGPLHVDPADAPGDQAKACRRLVAALPETVADQPRRDVDPAGSTVAAWGDPAIVLRCGVGTPDGFDDLSTCQVTNGVGWFIPEEQITGEPTEILMTTVDRTPAVQVRIPREYFPPAAAMVNLAAAIKQTTVQDDPCL
ncbi:DUF3515 domain-containing protein [Nocardioides mesophilus]|uniref:DUF3515 domain-containing protein n=1 Tax=Nocardioides mesophilus TaxID=433659 RepID=A0A7G9R918_9ACTN|nr:DUF3515 domain-containing protein [Nocardioides mesophilus]QNN52093.1 DUF3515 domain-containing protein [Nocardioides mesophilus]